MELIHEPNESFDFNKISLTTPTISSGGNYFIKYRLPDDNSLYIQPPKCTTKQGIVKASGGKKLYCDLVFSNTNESFIKWLEDLEKYSQEFIFKNREKWFESHLELEDIENSFAPSLKIYKSGKSYILRTVVPTRLGKCGLKIFNEDETEFNADDFKETTNVITILEIQGIKCSSKSFQIEAEIKQMMVLKPAVLFEKCVIRPSHLATVTESKSGNDESLIDKQIFDHQNDLESPTAIEQSSDSTQLDFFNSLGGEEIPNSPKETETQQNPPPIIKDELVEVDLDLEEIEDDTLNLTDRNEIYRNIYKEAVEKAKEARDLAICAYLEAKRIKKLYMINDGGV